jgi:large subunit ribosomal protein L30
MPAKIEIKQIKGAAGLTDHQRRVLRALGLRRREQSVVHDDTPQIKGMVTKVAHLVKVTQK